MPTQLDQLLALLDQQEARVRRAFLRFLEAMRSPFVVAELLELIEAGDFAGASRLVDSYVQQFGNVIPEVMREVGIATSVELAAGLPDIALAIGFDASNPEAARIAAESRVRLITEFSEQQHRATNQAIGRAVGEGRGAAEIARSFRESLGLTMRQEAAVANYRAHLESLDRRALERALRDRRFDDRVATAINRSRPLTARQIDTMVTRYRARSLAARADTIARTEALTAYSQAREESLRQMLEQTGIEPDRVDRLWFATHDKRVRDFHLDMDRQRRPLGEPFRDGHGNLLRYPGDPDSPAETRINCRCTLGFEVRPERDLVRAA